MNVYDFDNTIYRGESVLHFFFFYIKKTPYLIKYIPKVFLLQMAIHIDRTKYLKYPSKERLNITAIINISLARARLSKNLLISSPKAKSADIVIKNIGKSDISPKA